MIHTEDRESGMIARKILTFRKLGSSASISFLSSFLVKAFPCLPSWAYLLNTVIMESMDFSKSVMVAEMSAERTKGRNGHKYNRVFFLLLLLACYIHTGEK